MVELVTSTASEFGVEFGAIRAVNGDYLKENGTMAEHYGVINAISTGGVDAITTSAKAKLDELFGEDIAAGAKVLGAHQFLDEVPEFNAFSLCVLNDNLGTQKLGGGTYALKLDLQGQAYILLNPFHPYQLVPYTTAGRGIILIEGRSTRDWADLRSLLAGTTDPSTAAKGAIRQKILANQETLGMKAVNQGANGVHLSAGALEGMVELSRFFGEGTQGVDYADTAFGALVASKGKSADDILNLAGNPDCTFEGKTESAFDLTEELNATDAAARLG